MALLDDVRSAARAVRAHWCFAVTVAAILAVAIAANSAVFQLVDAVLLSPLPFPDARQLVTIDQARPDGTPSPLSLPDFQDLREQNHTVRRMAAAFQWSANLTGGEAERLQAMRASASLFTVLGRGAARGRALLPEDERGSGRRVVVLTHGLWVRRFGASDAAIGASLVLNGDAYTIVGVLPRGFITPVRDAELIAPFPMETDPRRAARDAGFLKVVARLDDDVTADRARADLDAIMARLRGQYPVTNATHAGTIVAEWRRALTAKQRPTLLLLQAAVALVLIVACANLANLFLAASVRRAHEFEVRAALGATAARRVRQVVIETGFIAVAACAGALALHGAIAGALAALAPADLLDVTGGALNARVLVFVAVLAVSATVALAVLPALRLGSNGALRARRAASSENRRARNLLVCAEVAIASSLVIVAVLLSRSVANLQAVDPGVKADHLLTVRLSLPRARYKTAASIQRFADGLRPRLLALPGATDAAAVNVIPLNNYKATADVWPGDRPAPPPDRADETQYRMVSASYVRTFGLPLLAGRDLGEHDGAAAARVVLVSRTLARRYWTVPGAIGKVLIVNDGGGPRPLTIVGVVGDVKHYGLDAEVTPDVYLPIAQVPDSVTQWLANNMYWGVRTANDPALLKDDVRRAVRAEDPDVPASALKTMDEALDLALAPKRLNLWLIRAFSVLALGLAAAGVYAVTAFTVALRRREMAIRAALGAGRMQNLQVLIVDATKPIALGLALGAAGALAGAPALRAVLFGVEPAAPGPFIEVTLLLLAVGIVAATLAALPARRVDAVEALIAE